MLGVGALDPLDRPLYRDLWLLQLNIFPDIVLWSGEKNVHAIISLINRLIYLGPSVNMINWKKSITEFKLEVVLII